MSRSTRYLEPDARRRVALGNLARHDLYLVTVDERGVITLTPAEVLPLPAPPPVPRKRARKKAAAAAGAAGESHQPGDQR